MVYTIISLYGTQQRSTNVILSMAGYRFHPLKGNCKGHYAVSVSGNWWLTFRFEGEDAFDVNLEDYH